MVRRSQALRNFVYVVGRYYLSRAIHLASELSPPRNMCDPNKITIFMRCSRAISLSSLYLTQRTHQLRFTGFLRSSIVVVRSLCGSQTMAARDLIPVTLILSWYKRFCDTSCGFWSNTRALILHIKQESYGPFLGRWLNYGFTKTLYSPLSLLICYSYSSKQELRLGMILNIQ